MLIAIFSCVYATRRLNRPGISKNIRHYFLQKHYYYVLIFTLVWGLYLSNPYYELFYNTDTNNPTFGKQFVEIASKVASVSTGILLTLVRLKEPYFIYQVKKRFYSFFGIIFKDLKK